jgi:ABC-type branched-subunit amino acid transport system ATPase component/branched-subunit amino acid ABC-type transport system permease component
MTQYLLFLLLGLGSGAVFASLALALVVTYRGSGVINFATGAVALYTAYTYAYLRQGKLVLFVPGLPTTVGVGGSLGLVPAAAIALVLAAAGGLALYVLVFRPLRTAPPVARAVASLGIMVLMQAVVAQRLGTSPVSVDAIFPSGTYSLGGGLNAPADRLWFAATIVVVAAVVAAVFRFTRFGLATRAAAETEKGAFVSGLSPDRVAALNWMISGAVAGLGGILIAPIVPLVPVAYTLFIVPALAAALVGRFQLLLPAVLAGLVIGMLQSETQYLQGRFTWWPGSGTAELVPLALILVVLLARGQPLPSRGTIIAQTLGRAPRPRRPARPAAGAVVIAVVGLVVLHGTWRASLVTSLIMAIIALSLVVVTGYVGQVSLAQLTLAGAAAFLLSTFTDDWGIPFPVAPLLAAAGAAAIGVIVGLPALRIRGLSVGVVTLALAVALEALWFKNNDLNGGGLGVKVTGPWLFGLDLRVGGGAAYPRLGFCLMCLVVLVLVALGVARLRVSRLGSAMLAVRANERSAAAAGVNVARTKLIGFAIGAFIAGLGGSLLAYQQRTVTFDSFDAIVGLSVFAVAYLAGITSVSGGVLAGFLTSGGLAFAVLDHLVSVGFWYEAVTGLLLVITVLVNPEGIVGPVLALADRARAGSAPAPAAPVPGAPAAGGLAAGAPAAGTPSLAAAAPREPVAAAAGSPPLLELRALGVRYGGVVAVADVSLDLPAGSITGLIGPNGAGKTTLIDAVSGFTRYTGSVALDGRPVDGRKPHERVRAGLARTFQAIELYDDLTVAENISVGIAARRGRAAAVLDTTCALLGLSDLRERFAGELSQGQRQLVSIGRALVGEPRVLLLDEPAAGLDTTESAWLATRLRDVRDSGVAMVLVDHDMTFVFTLCDRVHVLDFGSVIASGAPAEIRSDPAVAAAYLGTTHDRPDPEHPGHEEPGQERPEPERQEVVR